VQGYLDYQYSIALGKSSSDASNYVNLLNAQEIPIQEFPLDWDQRHQITLNVNINVVNGDHPRLFGLKMPDNWNMNLIWQYGSGFPFTPSALYPGLPTGRSDFSRTNSLRRPPNSQVDVRFQKSFRIWKQDYTLQLWVNNLFDRKNIQSIFANTGRTNTNNVVSFQTLDAYGNTTQYSAVVLGSPFQNDPRTYQAGRNIKLGLSVDF
jgi:outer membrane receptor protein involved in Fe transport